MAYKHAQQTGQLTTLAGQLEETNQQLLALASRQNAYEAAANQNNTPTQSSTQDDIPTSQPTDLVQRPKPSLNDPERYDHSDKSLYPQFAGLLRAKIKHDGLAISSEEKRAWYMFRRLRGLAAKRIFS